MSVTPDEERRHYDGFYAKQLVWPDEKLLYARGHVLAYLDDPAQPAYERRRLYRAALEAMLAEPVAGRAVLDYGCGSGKWGVLLATEGACVTLLDLSPVAIEVGLRRARANGVAERVRGVARDAANLACFADGEFDLVIAGAALHHTLKYPNALAELLRVIRPGGRLVLAETFGNNRLLNWARRLRWHVSGEPEEAGEDIILSDRELDWLRPHFRRLEVRPLNLLAMGKRVFRRRFTNPLARGVVYALEAADGVLLAVFPFLRRYCGEVLVVAVK